MPHIFFPTIDIPFGCQEDVGKKKKKKKGKVKLNGKEKGFLQKDLSALQFHFPSYSNQPNGG